MKKAPELPETLAKSAGEAKEILHQTAELIEGEWQRLKTTVEESDSVPEGVKSAMGRLGEAVDEVKDFVVTVGSKVAANASRAAREAGVPIPDTWFAGTVSEEAPVDQAMSDLVETADEAASAADSATDSADAVVDDPVEEPEVTVVGDLAEDSVDGSGHEASEHRG